MFLIFFGLVFGTKQQKNTHFQMVLDINQIATHKHTCSRAHNTKQNTNQTISINQSNTKTTD